MPSAFQIPTTRRAGLGVPQRKPWGSIARFELDPGGALSWGLGMALIPDGPLGVGGLHDYAAPSRVFTSSGGTPTFGSGQYGNQVNCGFGTATALSFTPAGVAPATSFSFSTLVLFDGSGHGDIGAVLLSDGVSAHEIVSTQTATNSPLSVGGGTGTHADSASLFVALLTGWHRVGCTYDGTQVRFFLDGKFTDSAAFSTSLTAGAPSQILSDTGDGSFSWGWPVADMFYWNRMLSDRDMLMNFAAPYRTILRPRFSQLSVVGAVAPTLKKGGLLTLGVGP